jgi:GNAT superfamily N-acetyltransferase
LAISKEKIVGMRGMFEVNLEHGISGNIFQGLYPDDFVISPEHRNRGLAGKIMKEALKDVEKNGYTYVFNMSAGHITRIASLAMGWRSAGTMEVQFREPEQATRFRIFREYVKKKGLFRRLAGKYSYRPWAPKKQDAGDLIKYHAMRSRNVDSNITIEQTSRPEEMARLITKIAYDGRIRHVRDTSYLSWRFKNPLHRYLFVYWKETELEGYLVLQEYISDMMEKVGFNIVDWEGTSLHVRTGLLRKAVELCSSTLLNIWSTTLCGETRTLLKDSGFRPGKEIPGVGTPQPCLLVRPVQDDMLQEDWLLGRHRLLDMSSWDIRMIYSMHG